jgi:alginate O-acetyltransferase complex protein AlgI
MNVAKQIIGCPTTPRTNAPAFVGWLPLVLLPTAVFMLGRGMAPWIFMWAIAFALYYACKWLTWWQNRWIKTTMARNAGYLLAWPGMDAKAFLNPANIVQKPNIREWLGATATALCGAVIVWGITRRVPAADEALRGWVGLVGFSLVLNFGTFRLLSLAWRAAGIDAQPLMRAPALATSLGEFWGVRWNSAFNRLVYDEVFRRTHRTMGIGAATMLVFFVSGLVHELVISLPARGGYGLPTIYFLIQGVGLLFERTTLAHKLHLRHGVAGWLFTVIVTAGPAFWLFHPAFITRVILPFLHVLNAI